ncbi:MAG: CxxC-x17-CxxC domain-containing protein [Patescibacteria group bacterium]
MGNYNRGDRFNGKKRFDSGDRGFRKGGQSDRPTMHQVICSDCGKDCEVPFRPTGDKPVYCSACFGNKDNSNKSRNERRSSGRPSFGDKPMFKAVCDKCHEDCEVPFRPTGDKPVFCSDCFGKTERGGGQNKAGNFDQHKKQFEILNTKLDNILGLLSFKTSPVKSAVKSDTTNNGAKNKKIIKEEKPASVKPKKIVKKKTKTSKDVAKKKVVKKAKKK